MDLTPTAKHDPVACCVENQNATLIQESVAIGYVRVDLITPSLERQKEDLERFGATVKYIEYASGSAVLKDALHQAIHSLSRGDILVVWRLDILTWRLDDLLEILLHLEVRQSHLVSIVDGFDSRKPMTAFDFAKVVSGFERIVRLDRKSDPWPQLQRRIEANEITAAEAARQLGVDRSTISRRMNP